MTVTAGHDVRDGPDRPNSPPGRTNNGTDDENTRRVTGGTPVNTLACAAPLSERPGNLAAYADVIRMTPMLAAARCPLFFFRCCARDRNVEARPVAPTFESIAKQQSAAMNTEKPQPAPVKSDPASFFFVWLTFPPEPRAAATSSHRTTGAPAPGGC